MFYDFAHFKKATQLLFKETCSNGMTLCQYRDRMAQMIGFSNQQSLKENFEKSDQKIHAVSVVVFINDTLHSKYDFKDTDAGNKQAEELFKNMLQEYMPSYDDENIDECLDNGYFEDDSSNYQLFITHSSE